MNDMTVACACGRTMTPDALAGRGSFRCGCGVRVKITIAIPASCTGLAEDGHRCRLMPVRESAQFSLSLCAQHYQGYLDMLDLIREGERASETIEQLATWTDEDLSDEIFREHRRMYAEQAVVYYVRIRDLIKIGTTTNMRARMSRLLADEVLATEPGGEELENMRHKQFAHLKVRGERFAPAPDLLSHIAMIRDHFGEPQMTGYIYSKLAQRRVMDRKAQAASLSADADLRTRRGSIPEDSMPFRRTFRSAALTASRV
jgi:hypothetical protein